MTNDPHIANGQITDAILSAERRRSEMDKRLASVATEADKRRIAKSLLGSMGRDMVETLTTPPKPPKKSFFARLKKSLTISHGE